MEGTRYIKTEGEKTKTDGYELQKQERNTSLRSRIHNFLRMGGRSYLKGGYVSPKEGGCGGKKEGSSYQKRSVQVTTKEGSSHGKGGHELLKWEGTNCET